MATVTATITTGMLELPSGTAAPSTYRIALANSAGQENAQSFASPPSSVTFPNVPPGRGYTVIGEQFDAAGGRVGARVTSAAFDIQGVLVTVIGAISVQIQPG